MVQRGLEALCNLEHRGAAGAESNTGDGAGILIQLPDRFLREVVDFELPDAGAYATGIAFLPAAEADLAVATKAVQKIVDSEGLVLLGWRDVPIDDSMIGASAKAVEPTFRQLFVAGPPTDRYAGLDLERRAFILRKRIEH